jgi:Zn-dependent protease
LSTFLPLRSFIFANPCRNVDLGAFDYRWFEEITTEVSTGIKQSHAENFKSAATFRRRLRLRNKRRNLSLSGVITPQFLVLGLIWYIVFLFSTTCHEGGHSLAAYLGGDTTAFQGGQMSLNPLPHIRREPMGLVVVPILSYLIAHWMIGWASAPYNPSWQQRYPRRAAWMALAGPAANFVLVIASALLIRLGMAMGFFRFPESVGFTSVVEAAVPGVAGFAATFLSILFVLNLLLGTFNLLPVPPLDGNTGITLLMREQTALRFLNWTRSQGFGMAGLLLAWVLYDKIFGLIFRISLSVLYPGSHWG